MRAVLAGVTLAAFVITPSLADYYIIQEPTTKRCRIVEERPASPGVGIVIGGAGFGKRHSMHFETGLYASARTRASTASPSQTTQTKNELCERAGNTTMRCPPVSMRTARST